MNTLLLEVQHFADARHWQWLLQYAADQDAGYPLLAFDEISLDPPGGDDGEDWPGTSGWLRSSVASAPDQPAAIAEARRWLGEHLMPTVGPVIAAQAPVTVHVRVRPEELALLRYPLELGSVADPEADGGFVGLAENNVSFVYEVIEAKAGPARLKDPVGDRLRVLAIFTEPAGATLPTLDKEQLLLGSQVDRLAKRRKAIDLRILPYGMTRDRLRSCLEEGEGWDVVHISGYGVTGSLAMWDASPLPIAELAKDLKLIRHRLKLITLVDREPPRAAGNGPAGRLPDSSSPAADGNHDICAASLDLAGALDCAVLTFRYPACEPFALAFTLQLFHYLLDKEHRLSDAVHLAAGKAAAEVPSGHGLCCRPGPVLFGARAVNLPLAPPRQPPASYDVGQFKMTGFPKQELAGSQTPIALRARAEEALGESSAYRGVVLTGPGAATRPCALELAYGHRDDFEALIWHQGPAGPSEVPGSFNALVRSLDGKLPGLRMAEKVNTVADLRDFIPELTGLLEAKLVLVMIAGVDMLLAAQGHWKDPSWQAVVGAMAGHQGGSRLVVTATRTLVGVDGTLDQLHVTSDGAGGN